MTATPAFKRTGYFLAQRDLRTVNPPSMTSSGRETAGDPAQMCKGPPKGSNLHPCLSRKKGEVES